MSCSTIIDNDNYYRVSFSYSDGFSRLEKKVGGVFTTLAQNARGFPTGTPFKIICEINNGIIQVSVATDTPNFLNEEKLFSAYDTSLSSGTVALYCRDGCSFDDVEIRSPGTAASVSISSPADYSVFPTATFDVSAVVMNQPTNGAVDFSLDGNTARCTGETEVSPGVWQAQCTAASAGFHSLTASLSAGGPDIDSDTHNFIATDGDYYITIGDSIFWGQKDFYSGDGSTQDDSIVMLQGFQSNLADGLNASSIIP